MRDLFTLQDNEDHGSTETSNIFNQLSNDVNIASIDSSSNDSQVENPPEGTDKTKMKASETSGAQDEETDILKCLFVANGIHVSFSSFFSYLLLLAYKIEISKLPSFYSIC